MSHADPLSCRMLIKKSFFGVHILNPNAQWHDIGHGSIRLWDTATTWKNIEKSKGVFDWTRMDQYIKYADSHGLEVLYECGQAPDWAGKPDSYADYNGHPPDRNQDWTDYLTAVATRYRGKIQAYEIWNEADAQGQGGVVRFWLGTWARLAELCRLAHSALKAVDPTVTVLSPSFTRFNPSMLGQFLDAVAADYRTLYPDAEDVDYTLYFDAVALHTYDYAPEDITATTGANQVRVMRNVIADRGINLPLWNTETGFGNYDLNGISVTTGNQFIPNDINVMPDDLSSAYIVREYLMNLYAGFERMFYYAADYRANRLRLINPLDLTKTTPAGDALKKLSDLLTGAVIDNMWLSNNLYAISFVKNCENFCILWNPDYKTGTWTVTQPSRIMFTETMQGVKSRPSNGAIETSNQPLIAHGLQNSIGIPAFSEPKTTTSAMTGVNSNGVVGIIPQRANLVLNGDFSQGDSLWDYTDNTTGVWTFDNNASLAFFGQRTFIGQNIYAPDVRSGATYRITYRFTGQPSSDSSGNVFVIEYDSGYSPIGQHLKLRSGDTFSTAREGLFYLRLYVGAGDTGAGTCAFGDISITEIYTVVINYIAGPGGSISGPTHQNVVAGGSAVPVTAVPDSGYEFTNWSDGVLTAERTDTNVLRDIPVIANFAPITSNLVVNGDFATRDATGWDVSGAGIGNTLDFSEGKAVLTCNGAAGFIMQFMNARPNTTYKMTFAFTGASTGGNGGNVMIEEWQGAAWRSGHYVLNMRAQPITFTTAPTTDRLLVKLGSGSLTTGVFTFDDIVVEPV